MPNGTSAERVQRRWDERAAERTAWRERLEEMNPVRRWLSKLWAAVKVLLLGAVLVSVLLGVVALTVLFIWYVVTGVISADWERAGG